MCRFFKHLGTVIKHKAVVFKLCCKCGIFWQGLWHDMSKFSITEFNESVKYFTDGKSSPLNNSRKQNGYSLAWLHHKGRNKHHVEFWYDEINDTQAIMPYKYAVESLCDKIASTKTYRKKDYTAQDVLDYWNKEKQVQQMNSKIKEFFNTVLTDLVNLGEKHVLNKKYLKQQYSNIVTNTK